MWRGGLSVAIPPALTAGVIGLKTFDLGGDLGGDSGRREDPLAALFEANSN